mmetsp:Transcript_27759/g.111183  ORF Transcript_27759/g.111183 Transcript_27759/m.111183 type:complete len:108 (+) Transcript_27759:64-387(+)
MRTTCVVHLLLEMIPRESVREFNQCDCVRQLKKLADGQTKSTRGSYTAWNSLGRSGLKWRTSLVHEPLFKFEAMLKSTSRNSRKIVLLFRTILGNPLHLQATIISPL